MRIGIVDDDRDIIRSLAAGLQGEGLTVETFGTAAAFRIAVARDTFDAVIIDWNMPGETGIELVRWATRNLPHPPPFLMMTSRTHEADIVEGLEAGASDFIVKPVSLAVLRARVMAAVRDRSRRAQGTVRKFDRYTIDHPMQTIRLDDEAIALTLKEFRLAALLFDNLDRPLSRDYLLAEVWSAAAGVETRTLDVHVSRIRAEIEDDAKNPQRVLTVRGAGYLFAKRQDVANDE